MILGGLQKSSLIDYPGHVSCVLFTQGCNFRCPYCHNPSLVLNVWKTGKIPIHEEDVLAFLKSRKGLLDGVVISGGEPTLHNDLFQLCAGIKNMGYRVKLDTNGSRPEVLARLVSEDLVDYIAMDLKTLPQNYGRYIRKGFPEHVIHESIDVLLKSGKPCEFRTTCVYPLVNAHVMEAIAKCIHGAPLYVLQPFVSEKVLCPEFFEHHGGRGCTHQDLERFRRMAEKWVQKCDVRR